MAVTEVQSASLKGLKSPTRAEIEGAVGPFITKRMSMSSPEWREIFEREARKEKKLHRKEQLRKIIPWRKHARHLEVVSGHYETHWSQIPWPKTHHADPAEKTIVSFWENEGMLIRGYGRKRAHHLLFARIVRELKPRRALEVGCGNGFNLLIMATVFPEMEWHGVELTEAGVQVGSSIQQEVELPEALREFSVEPIADPGAHRKVKLRQGDASRLPYRDGEFDLVFSFLALEQMQSVRDQALSEMARVTARHTINVEPFRDYNQLPIQKHYREARGYLDLQINEMARFGLNPIFTFDHWPQKLTLAAGAVVTEKK